MHVTSLPIPASVALVEQRDRESGSLLRVLVFQEGLLPRPILILLGKLLSHV